MAGRYRSSLEQAVNELAAVLEPQVQRLIADVFEYTLAVLEGSDVPEDLGYLTAAVPWTPDDAAVLPAAWEKGVQVAIVPTIQSAYDVGALTALARRTPGPDLPSAMEAVLDRAGAEYLAQASRRVVGIGDTMWKDLRAVLVEEYSRGAPIEDAADSLRGVMAMSEARAETIARTEMVGAANAGTLEGAKLGGFNFKAWLATLGPRTRPSHAAADGQVVAIGDPFTVGAAHLDHPGDPSGPAGEVINCRCTILLVSDAEAEEIMGRGGRGAYPGRESGGPKGAGRSVLVEVADDPTPPLPPKPSPTKVSPHDYGLATVDPEWVKANRATINQGIDALIDADARAGRAAPSQTYGPGELGTLEGDLDPADVDRWVQDKTWDPLAAPDPDDFGDEVTVIRVGDRRIVINGSDRAAAASTTARSIRVTEYDLRSYLRARDVEEAWRRPRAPSLPDPDAPKPGPKVSLDAKRSLVRAGHDMAGHVDKKWATAKRRKAIDAALAENAKGGYHGGFYASELNPQDLFALDEKLDFNVTKLYQRDSAWNPREIDFDDPVVVVKIGERRIVVHGQEQAHAVAMHQGPAGRILVLEHDLTGKFDHGDLDQFLRIVVKNPDARGGFQVEPLIAGTDFDPSSVPEDLRAAGEARAAFIRKDRPTRLQIADDNGYGRNPSELFEEYEAERQAVGEEIHRAVVARMQREGYTRPGAKPGSDASEIRAAELEARDATAELQTYVYDWVDARGGSIEDLPSPWFDPRLYIEQDRLSRLLADDPEYERLRAEWSRARQAERDAKKGLADAPSYEDRFVDVLNDVLRDLGIDTGPGRDFSPGKMWDRDAPKATGDRMLEALQYYPRSMINRSLERLPFTLKQVPRGYYSGAQRILAISGKAGSARETAVHEFGHRMEDLMGSIRASEWAFYRRRTKGEKLAWLGEGYAKSEKTREDKFANAYMGKEYGIGDQQESWELWTMVAQQLLWKPDPGGTYRRPSWGVRLHRDRDMITWWLGTLVTSA